MKKSMLKKAITLALTALCACSLTCGTVLAAAQTAGAGSRAASGVQLFMPSSYEQYLDLNNPSDIEVNDDYLAIADGAELILYYRNGGTQFYTQAMDATISSLQLIEADGSTWLFFLENGLTSSQLKYLECSPNGFVGEPEIIYPEPEPDPEEPDTEDPGTGEDQPGTGTEQPGTGEEGGETQQPQEPIIIPTDNPYETGIECASYLINQTANGTYLYYAPSSNTILRLQMNGTEIDENSQTTITQGSNFIVPVFASANGVPYYTWGTDIRNALTGATEWSASQAVAAFAITGSDCYYISATNASLYRAAAAGQAAPTSPFEDSDGNTVTGVRALHYFDEMLYIAAGDTVRGFDPTTGSFTNYEISRYSTSEYRLGANARDISVYDDKVVIADTGNGRVLIYDEGTRNFTAFTPDISPLLVAAGEDVFAVADEYNVHIYSYGGQLLHSQGIGSEIFDITYSFGNFYLVDNTAVRKHTILQTESGYSLQAATASTTETFLSVTADIGGYVYTLADDGTVYRYDDDLYLSTSGESLCDMDGATQIVADYAGNVFGLAGSTVTKYNPNTGNSSNSSVSLDGLVADANTTPVAFAFGFQNDTSYILADGFIATTQNIGVNALSTIPATGLYDTIYTAEANENFASGRLVRVQQGAVTVQVNLASLENMDTLDCSDYERETQERIGVLLTETDAGALVMFYSETVSDNGVIVTRSYETCLVLGRGGYQTISDDTALHAARDEAGQPFSVGYTTNAVGLYKYPLMATTNADGTNSTFCMITSLAKSTELYVISALYLDGQDVLDSEGYYFVRVQDLAGNATYGFVPMRYVLPYMMDSATSQPFTIGHLTAGADWTLTAVDGSTYTAKEGDLVHIYGEEDENGLVVVSYQGEDGKVYRGMIRADMIYEANEAVVYALIFVPIVTAVVLLSLCYLIYRKQPTLS